jgi:hypothetical protein
MRHRARKRHRAAVHAAIARRRQAPELDGFQPRAAPRREAGAAGRLVGLGAADVDDRPVLPGGLCVLDDLDDVVDRVPQHDPRLGAERPKPDKLGLVEKGHEPDDGEKRPSSPRSAGSAVAFATRSPSGRSRRSSSAGARAAGALGVQLVVQSRPVCSVGYPSRNDSPQEPRRHLVGRRLRRRHAAHLGGSCERRQMPGARRSGAGFQRAGGAAAGLRRPTRGATRRAKRRPDTARAFSGRRCTTSPDARGWRVEACVVARGCGLSPTGSLSPARQGTCRQRASMAS